MPPATQLRIGVPPRTDPHKYTSILLNRPTSFAVSLFVIVAVIIQISLIYSFTLSLEKILLDDDITLTQKSLIGTFNWPF
jgi:hypothetical protein